MIQTLFKASDPALVHASGLNTFNSQLKLNCLPLWICLQSLGHDGILERVKASCKLVRILYPASKVGVMLLYRNHASRVVYIDILVVYTGLGLFCYNKLVFQSSVLC